MEQGRNTTFEDLMARVTAGSEEAVWEVVALYSTNILRAVRRSLAPDLRRKVDSTDIVQSVWKSLLTKQAPLDGIKSAAEFVAYVAGMALNKVYEVDRRYKRAAARDIRREVSLDHFARKGKEGSSAGRRGAEPADPSLHTPDQLAEIRERWRRSLSLGGERATAVVEMRMKRSSDEEIGAALGISPVTVRREIRKILDAFST